MQMAESNSMAQFNQSIAMQLFYNLGRNNISSAGCRWLKKANWKKIVDLNLSNNKIIKNKIKLIGRAANI